MHHAIDLAGETDEQTEFGDVLDLAFERATRRVLVDERRPRIVHALLQAEADAALGRIHVEDHDFDFLAGRDDLARMHVLLGPAHFGNVDQAFDARLEFHERAVIGDVGDAALQLRADRVLGGNAFPGIGLKLLHAEADALRLGIEAHDLDVDRLADVERFRGMVDAAPRDVGDVQQTIDATEVHERTVIGDVLHDTLQNLAFLEVGDEFAAGFRAALFEHRATRDDDVAAGAVHLQNLERLRRAHERANVAHRTDVDLAARQERDGAIEIDGETTLHTAEDHAGDALVVLELLFERGPRFFALRLLAAQHRFAVLVFHALEEHLDHIADLDFSLAGRATELTQGHAAFGLQANINEGKFAVDTDNGAGEHRAFEALGKAQ